MLIEAYREECPVALKLCLCFSGLGLVGGADQVLTDTDLVLTNFCPEPVTQH